jgi:hypothetical protein
MWDIKTLKKTFNLNKLYKEYNSKYFKGKLGDVVFDVYVQGKNDIPSIAYENTYIKRNGGYLANINFNAECNWNEENICKFLLHEMIHYYHYVLLGKGTILEHGILFRLTQLRLLICHGIYVPIYGGRLVKIKKEVF